MQTADLTCIICGEPSNGYHFCKKCWKKYNEEIIDLRIYNCSDTKILDDDEIETNCLICGDPSNGYHFCKECFQKVRTGADLRIAPGGTGAEIIDPYGNRKFKANNGVWTRSQGEQSVLNWLYNNYIRAEYEKTVMYEDLDLKPDFYLPDFDLYIEYNGREDQEYLQRKKETMSIYKKLKLNVITLDQKDLEDPDTTLPRKLKPYGYSST